MKVKYVQNLKTVYPLQWALVDSTDTVCALFHSESAARCAWVALGESGYSLVLRKVEVSDG